MTKNNFIKVIKKVIMLLKSLYFTGYYNIKEYIDGEIHKLTECVFFYVILTSKHPSKDPSKVFFDLDVEPQVHQLVYVELGGGYPKELRGAHYCYVLKNSGPKPYVIPVTSVKENSGPYRTPYELDIEEEDGTIARLHFDEGRHIDKMRIRENRPYINICTPYESIAEADDKYWESTK